ncbi:cupin domain-containing protein [Oceanobacter mangrovi]|uniref:cupin domain-containing protein n=1 Tax=Oceanobacter mangrovi TaxID=2862510 RepID=UPI001C8D39E2|nr:cupin domain-containing protein [Oceanobacter mangrovi]
MTDKPTSLPTFKRVVTGHNSDGAAIVSETGLPPVIQHLQAVPGTVFYEIWNSSEMPVAIDNGTDPTLKPLQLSPTANGSVIRVVDIPPDSQQNAISEAAAADAFAEIGQASAHQVNSPKSNTATRHKLMHRTETLDYGVVLCGEVWLVLDDEEIHLQQGDIVVQRGTNHAWSNRTETMARMMFVLLDGQFRLP